MSDKQRVFISFAGADHRLAARLHEDLSKRGAEVFQFLESAEPGTEAWAQVLDSIDKAAWFIVLLSEASVKSGAVRYEVRHAHHGYINRGKPKLIPAMVDRVEKPNELRIFTDLPLEDYSAALGKLTTMLGLDQATKEQPSPSRERRSRRMRFVVAMIAIGIGLASLGYYFWPTSGFYEPFDGTALTSKWIEKGRTPIVDKGAVVVSGEGSVNPLIATSRNPFPRTGNFELTMSFQYTSLKHWGQALSVGTAVPPLGESRGKYALQQAVLEVIQDSDVWDFTVFVLGNEIHRPRNMKPHTIKLVYSGHYTVTLDGEMIHVSDPTDRRPTTIWFGEPRQEPGDWSALRVDEIAVRQIP